MKIGVRAHDFGRQSAESLAAAIKTAGFECVQLAPAKAINGITHFGDITEARMEEAVRAFEQSGVEITVLGCYIEPSVTDRETRLANIRIFQDNLGFAGKFGIGIVGTETTYLDISTPPAEREKAFSLLKDSVLRMAEVAAVENVYIGIEPVAEHTLNTPELTRRLLDEVNCDKLKVIFDPVNLVLPGTIDKQEEIFTKFLDLAGHEIEAMHIKDIAIENGEKAWRNIGKGVIDYKPVIKWLNQNKPQMRLIREDVDIESYADDRKAMEFMIKGN